MQSRFVVAAVLAATSAMFSAAVNAEEAVKARNSGWDVLTAKNCGQLVYPEAARREEQTGTVVLSFHIDANGRVLDADLARPSHYPMLVEASRTALMSCIFQRIPGAPPPPAVEMREIAYEWRLESPPVVAPKP
jgi:TonB family protein